VPGTLTIYGEYKKMTATVHGFQTQVTKLLDLLANSLYSNKEVFLRELISNASDAIDKLHFMSLTNQDLIKDDPNFKIQIRADKDAKTLTITDNGIGMTLEEANNHLGTIAESGTEEFMKNLTGDAKRDSQLIGQFGVGFYSSFIVADKVLHVLHIEEPIAKGIAIGSASHAMGTAHAMELGQVEGAMSGLSIVVSGIVTVLAAICQISLVEGPSPAASLELNCNVVCIFIRTIRCCENKSRICICFREESCIYCCVDAPAVQVQ